jgi:hypothetical protein
MTASQRLPEAQDDARQHRQNLMSGADDFMK